MVRESKVFLAKRLLWSMGTRCNERRVICRALMHHDQHTKQQNLNGAQESTRKEETACTF